MLSARSAANSRDAEAPAGPDQVTDLLNRWSAGSPDALGEVLALVAGRLRRIAAGQLQGERVGHTLEPTDLVNEAYLRIERQSTVRWRDRRHFFTLTAMIMRRILVDHARRRSCVKRGRDWRRVSLEEVGALRSDGVSRIVDLDLALKTLAEFDDNLARLVELRFFGGLSIAETAEALGCSNATVARRWRLAKAWLLHELENTP